MDGNYRKKGLDVDLSVNYRISTFLCSFMILHGIALTTTFSYLITLTGAFNMILFFLLTFRQNQFARGFSFSEEILSMQKGMGRKPVIIPWNTISDYQLTKGELKIWTGTELTPFDLSVGLTPRQRRNIEHRVHEEFKFRLTIHTA